MFIPPVFIVSLWLKKGGGSQNDAARIDSQVKSA
jgi:hypothetical protein